LPSTRAWVLVVKPPPERPMAWSPGSSVRARGFVSFGAAPCVRGGSGHGPGSGRAVLVDPGAGGVGRQPPVDLPLGVPCTCNAVSTLSQVPSVENRWWR
jgi:hypothetical protein